LGRTCTGWIAPACGWRTYSITSSARASSEGGTVRPSIRAVWTLMTSSNLLQRLSERRKARLTLRIGLGHTGEHTNAPDAFTMLRVGREWPRHRAAEPRHKFPPLE
jgi:hypothetical protein